MNYEYQWNTEHNKARTDARSDSRGQHAKQVAEARLRAMENGLSKGYYKGKGDSDYYYVDCWPKLTKELFPRWFFWFRKESWVKARNLNPFVGVGQRHIPAHARFDADWIRNAWLNEEYNQGDLVTEVREIEVLKNSNGSFLARSQNGTTTEIFHADFNNYPYTPIPYQPNGKELVHITYKPIQSGLNWAVSIKGDSK